VAIHLRGTGHPIRRWLVIPLLRTSTPGRRETVPRTNRFNFAHRQNAGGLHYPSVPSVAGPLSRHIQRGNPVAIHESLGVTVPRTKPVEGLSWYDPGVDKRLTHLRVCAQAMMPV